MRQDGSRHLTWLDLHNLIGIVTVVWGFVVGVTGVVNALSKPLFSQWRSAMIAQLTAPSRGEGLADNVITPQKVVDTALGAGADWDVDFIAFPGTALAGPRHYLVLTRGRTVLTSRLSVLLLIDAATGRLAAGRTLPWYLTVLRIVVPIHFADYGGMAAESRLGALRRVHHSGARKQPLFMA